MISLRITIDYCDYYVYYDYYYDYLYCVLTLPAPQDL